ncbi:MAG TPA: GerMN domain-containing protein [Syntrophales bacterium]|nr:GerMN domain-containing protein [Syntrophales bacterium]
MATKKKRRTDEIKIKKKKKRMKKSVLFLVVTTIVACLILFFLIIFEYVFPPTKESAVKREKKEVVLYFSDANERFLLPEKRYVSKEENDEAEAREIVKALLEGSKTKLVNTFPEKVGLDGVKIDDKHTAYVSFDKNLIRQHPGGGASEMATIYSLTNTLIRNIGSIKRVKLLIEGKEVESIRGHVDARQFFIMNKDMLAPGAKEG